MSEHNYKKKIAGMIARGEFPQEPGKFYVIDVIHKDGCESCEGGICNCDCKILVNELDAETEKVH